MKVKTIFRGAVAGLMSMSLLLSGMPVMATDLDSSQQMETEGEAPAPAQQEQPQQPEAKDETPDPSKDQETPQQPEGGQETPQQPGTEGETPDPSKDQETPQQPGTEGETPDPNKDQETPQQPGAQDETPDPSKDQETPQQPETGDKTPDPAKDEDKGKDKDKKSEEDKKIDEGQKIDKDPEDKESPEKKEGEEEIQSEHEDEPQTFSLANLPMVNGSIAIDGDMSDWAEVAARSSGASNVDSWKVAFSPDKNMLYFCYTGSASTEWDYGFASNENSFKFTYADGQNGQDSALSVNAWNGGAIVKNAQWGDVAGAQAAAVNEAHGNNAGPYTVEFAVPVSFFHSLDFTLSFGGTTIGSGEIEQVNGNVIESETPPVYTGITIDGAYSDWAAVAKTDTSCPNDAHKGCISQVAAIFDGDWLYLYIKDGKDGNASGAGSHSNGKFAITSDLGYETDIQLSTAPAVNGVNGAQIAYVGDEWEVAIPKDQLPKYKESLSFGLYLGEPIVGGIVNMQPDNGNNLENLFNGIIYDGAYEDWEDYGHTTIEYATAGSQEAQVDAKGALYTSGEQIFGHVVTNMPQHLQEAGGEFTSAITIAFNQSDSDLKNHSWNQQLAFYPRLVTVDTNGNINWNPQLSGLPEGSYEFHIASTDAWGTSANVNNLNDMDQLYGKMIITVGMDGKDEMEFYLDLPMIAKKLGVGETDLKQISAQFGRIGQQWLYTAGTSTGPIVGVTLCIATVGLALWYKKKNIFEIIFTAGK